MSANWFYAPDGQQQGPVDDEEFRRLVSAGTIRHDTLIWRDGLPGWEPMSRVADAPRPDAAEATPPPIGTCAVCGRVFPPDELVRLAGRPVCATCKPIALQSIEEGVGLPASRGRRRLPVDADALMAEIRARGYEVNIGLLLSRAWELYKAHFWPCVAASTLIMVLSQVAGWVPFLGMALSLLVTGPLFAGLYVFFLKVVRGQPAQVGDAFSGFSPDFWRYILTALVTMIPMFVVTIGVAIPVAIVFVLGLDGPFEQSGVIWFVLVPVILVVMLVAIYFQVAMMFALPLAADLELGPVNAALTSLRAVNLRVGWVLLLMVLTGFLILLGVLALVIGVFFTLPIGWLVSMLLYEEIFAPRQDLAAPTPAPTPSPTLAA